MTGNIQSRRIAPKDAAYGRCRGIAGVDRWTNQNKYRTKKISYFVLFSCIGKNAWWGKLAWGRLGVGASRAEGGWHGRQRAENEVPTSPFLTIFWPLCE